MAEIFLECQGLPCPQPVLKCRTLIEEQHPESLRVCVDNEAARQNVERFLVSQGYQVSVDKSKDGTYLLTGRDNKPQGKATSTECEVMSDEEIVSLSGPQKTLVFLPSDSIGTGDDTLGAKLMQAFLSTLPEMGTDLWRIVMVNSGVKLACKGSPSLEILTRLTEAGVSILVCGTCLEFFGLTADKQVGETTNMLDIVTSFQLADKVVRI